jgi:hypothetical protein
MGGREEGEDLVWRLSLLHTICWEMGELEAQDAAQKQTLILWQVYKFWS